MFPARQPRREVMSPLQRVLRPLAARLRTLDLSGLRHLVGQGIALSGFAVLVAGLVDPSLA